MNVARPALSHMSYGMRRNKQEHSVFSFSSPFLSDQVNLHGSTLRMSFPKSARLCSLHMSENRIIVL